MPRMRSLRLTWSCIGVAALSLLGCYGSENTPLPRDANVADVSPDQRQTSAPDVLGDLPSTSDVAQGSDAYVAGVDAVPDVGTQAESNGGVDSSALDGGRTDTLAVGMDTGQDLGGLPDAQVDQSYHPDTPVDVVTDSALDRSGDGQSAQDSLQGGEAGSSVQWTLATLPYRVLDAEYSRALEAIVLITDSPDRALHIYNPETGGDVRVALPLSAVAVSVSPAGDRAAVAHDAHVTYVDLVAGSALKTCDVTSDAIDVVLAGNGWAYVFPMTDQWSAIHGIKLSDCSETLSSSSAIYAGTVAALHPSGTKIYGADRGLSPSDIERYDISTGSPVYAYDSPYHGDYPMCGNLWISNDGLRIFTACGRVFRSSDTKSEDMTYNGRLEGADSIRHVSHASASGKVLVIPAASTSSYPSNPDGDTLLRVHDYQFLTLDRTIQLPTIPGQGSTTFKGHGRFVFARSTGGAYYVVLQADATSGLLNDYAVGRMTP